MRVLFFTDLHLGQNRDWRAGWNRALHEIRALKPDVLLCGGDVGTDETIGDTAAWLEALRAESDVPLHFCPGNHEIDTGFYNAARPHGSLCQSRSYGGAHFVILDGIRRTPMEANLWHNWYGEIDDAQLDWLHNELARIAPETPLILTTHIPLQSTLPLRYANEIDETLPHNAVRGADKVLCALQVFRNVACLSGHFHENERLNRGNIQILTTGAMAGNWWRAGIESFNLDGAPQGFRVLDVSPDSITSFYRAFTPEQRRETALFQSVDGNWFLNVFDGSAQTRVMLNDESLSFVEPNESPGEKRPAHLWNLPCDFENNRGELEIHFEDGRIARECIAQSTL